MAPDMEAALEALRERGQEDRALAEMQKAREQIGRALAGVLPPEEVAGLADDLAASVAHTALLSALLTEFMRSRRESIRHLEQLQKLIPDPRTKRAWRTAVRIYERATLPVADP